jgi:hypothetical protein
VVSGSTSSGQRTQVGSTRILKQIIAKLMAESNLTSNLVVEAGHVIAVGEKLRINGIANLLLIKNAAHRLTAKTKK